MRALAKIGVALTALVVSLSLSACGSGGGGDTATTAESQSSATSAEPAPGPARAAPPDRGEVSPRSAPFRGSSGPLRHMAEYGEEASSSERGQTQSTLSAYLTAIARGRWAAACSQLAPETLLQIRQLVDVASAPRPGWCGEAFPAYFAAAGRDVAELKRYKGLQVASFRVEGDAGFALIRGTGGERLWVAMKRSGGAWKLITPIPQSL